MTKIPTFDFPDIPEDSYVLKISNTKILIVSVIVEIFNILLSTFGLNNLNINNYIKVICFLSLTCVILFIVIILLYLKDREHHFKEVYLNNMYKLLCNQVDNNKKQIDGLSKEINIIKNK